MARKTKPAQDLKTRAVAAALGLAAAQGWAETTMRDIASACDCALAELQAVFEDKNAVLAAIIRQADQTTLENSMPDMEAPERERLFDILMERFDVLNENREAVLSILHATRTDPKTALAVLPQISRSMLWMLEAAGLACKGPRGMATVIGLLGVYLYTLKTWAEDTSPDMAKTMAALDRALNRAESFAGVLERLRPTGVEEPEIKRSGLR